MTTRIFIVDDDAAIRDSLSMLLDAAGYAVETFPGAVDFLNACTPDHKGCLILDINMPDMDGLALQDELLRRDISMPLIFLTGYGSIPTAVGAIRKGAEDFLTKPVDGKALLERIREVMQAKAEATSHVTDNANAACLASKLTSREREVLELVASGYSSKEIGLALGISHRTVEIHRSNLMKKTGSGNLADLLLFALRTASSS